MNKAEFIELVREKGEFDSKAAAVKAVDAVTKAITKALVQKESVPLVGFGTFSVALQKGRTGKVPGTNKEYTTEDKYVPKFKAGKSLKEAVGLPQ
ncbi:HU family DNA-binding protein [Sulfurimonas sp.]